MHIKYKLTTQDYINFNLYRIKHDEHGIAMVKKQRVMGSVSLMLLGAVFVIFSKVGQAAIAAIMIALSTFWYFNYPRLAQKRIVKATEKALKNANASDFFKELDVTVSEDGVAESDTSFTWEQVTSSLELRDTVYIFFEDNTTLIVPKRAVEDNYEDLLSIVQSSSKVFDSIEL